MSTKKTNMNYKAKWLAALEQNGLSLDKSAANVRHDTEAVIATETSVILELQRLKNHMVEVAVAAQSLTEVMGENRVSGGVDYGDIYQEIDSKLTKLPIHVLCRRVRDLMKLATFRIGMLSAAGDELADRFGELSLELSAVKNGTKTLQTIATEAFFVGPNPTREEIEDLSESNGDTKRYARYGLTYEDVNDGDFEYFGMTRRTPLMDNDTDDESDPDIRGHSEDEDSDSKNYAKAVVAIGKKQKHKANDSAISGISDIFN